MERGAFYGDQASYIMERQECSPNTIVHIAKDGVKQERSQPPNHLERLPAPLRMKSGHGGPHTSSRMSSSAPLWRTGTLR